MAPLFSLIVPVYNAEVWLDQCLNSIISQTYGNFEVFLIDDGSVDGSGAICDKFAAKDNRFHILHQKNCGPVSARQAGLKQVIGEYICFVDADDWVEPQWLETIYKYITEYHNPDIIIFDLKRDKGDVLQPIYAEPGYYDKAKLEKDIYPTMLLDKHRSPYGSQLFPGYLCTKVFRKELITKHYLQDNRITIFEDTAMTYECVFYASSAYITREKLYIYRKQTASNLNHYRPTYFQEVNLVMDYLRKHLGGNNDTIDEEINGFGVSRIIHGIALECRAHPKFPETVQNVRKALDESHFAAQFTLKGLPFLIAIFLILVKLRFYRAVTFLVKARMQPPANN